MAVWPPLPQEQPRGTRAGWQVQEQKPGGWEPGAGEPALPAPGQLRREPGREEAGALICKVIPRIPSSSQEWCSAPQNDVPTS